MTSSKDLQRFVDAQAPVLDRVRTELRAGRKTSHWMWFIFPQLVGLGSSAMARHYAIASLAEAEAYLRHPVLGPRLGQCAELVMESSARDVRSIFGSPDDLKFRSSMTLFVRAGGAPIFQQAIDGFFGGRHDERTLALLEPPLH